MMQRNVSGLVSLGFHVLNQDYVIAAQSTPSGIERIRVKANARETGSKESISKLTH